MMYIFLAVPLSDTGQTFTEELAKTLGVDYLLCAILVASFMIFFGLIFPALCCRFQSQKLNRLPPLLKACHLNQTITVPESNTTVPHTDQLTLIAFYGTVQQAEENSVQRLGTCTQIYLCDGSTDSECCHRVATVHGKYPGLYLLRKLAATFDLPHERRRVPATRIKPIYMEW